MKRLRLPSNGMKSFGVSSAAKKGWYLSACLNDLPQFCFTKMLQSTALKGKGTLRSPWVPETKRTIQQKLLVIPKASQDVGSSDVNRQQSHLLPFVWWLFYPILTSCTTGSLLCSWPHVSLPPHISWCVFTRNVYLIEILHVSHIQITLLKQHSGVRNNIWMCKRHPFKTQSLYKLQWNNYYENSATKAYCIC